MIHMHNGQWVAHSGRGCTSDSGFHAPTTELIREVDPDLERLLAEEDEIDRRAQEAALHLEDKRMRDQFVEHTISLRRLIVELQEQHDIAIREAHEAYAAIQKLSRSARSLDQPYGPSGDTFIEHFARANGLMLAISSLERL